MFEINQFVLTASPFLFLKFISFPNNLKKNKSMTPDKKKR